jgi:hypothetical protein
MPRRSVIRASDDERESVAERLRTAAAEGRLLASELEHRLALALRAKTLGELDRLVADLPLDGRRRRGRPARRPVTRVTPVRVIGYAAAAIVVLSVLAVVAVFVLSLVFLWGVWAFLALWLFGHRRGLSRGPWGGRGFRPPLRAARRGFL